MQLLWANSFNKVGNYNFYEFLEVGIDEQQDIKFLLIINYLSRVESINHL